MSDAFLMDLTMFWRVIPLVHAFVFALVAVVGRIVLVAARERKNPLTFMLADSAREYIARCFYFWLPAADGLYLIVYAVLGGGPALARFPLDHEWVRWLALVWMGAALGWIVLSQAHMGASWRMGVDDAAHAELMTSGPFAVSRHPVYLGIRATMLGQLLVLDTWPALVFWTVSELLVQAQVRFEEKSMSAHHGERYTAYCSRVRRWL
jgi:protein-S-isoprenylcysteine O-methyltransferase Ste14